MKSNQPWIYNAAFDLATIILPPVGVLIFLFGTDVGAQIGELNPIWWLVLIVGVDVSHVYSTLYRTYFDAEARKRYGHYLWSIPLICFGASVLLHSLGSLVFWTVMAYTAVFHFVRQQYGFLRIYSRKESASSAMKRVDALVIYGATIIPLLFWHLDGFRTFNWFVERDFFLIEKPLWANWSLVLYIPWGLMWVYSIIKTSIGFNWPKHLLVATTASSWFFGIVYFNNDLVFTALNVIGHGIPYIALIWIYGRKQSEGLASPRWKRFWFSLLGLPLFIGFLLVVAYFEEGFWDALIWHDHPEWFQWANGFPRITSDWALSMVVALLALPQLTHYVLDGFIWKVSKPEVQSEIGLK